MRRITILLLFLLPSLAFCENYYVSGTGDDKNDGLSPETAFRSLQTASDLTLPGDTVYAMNGNYSVTWDRVLSVNRSGTEEKWITYKNYPGHKPKILVRGETWFGICVFGASYIIIDGFEIEGNNSNVTLEYAWSERNNRINPVTSGNGIGIEEDEKNNKIPHHIILQNNTIYECSGGGMGGGGDYIIIRNNLVYECGFYSPYGQSAISILTPKDIDSYTGYKIFVTNNICHSNRNYIPFIGYNNGCCITDGNGIILDYYKETAYKGKTLGMNNLVYNNGGSGIHSTNSTNIDIINNTAYMNGQTDPDQYNPDNLQGEIYARSSDNINILNNIMYARPNAQLTWNSGNTNVVYNYNLYYNGRNNAADVEGSGPQDINNQDPLFVDPAAFDFWLRPESPAINEGSSSYDLITVDLAGNARVQNGIVDMGCYESSTAPSGGITLTATVTSASSVTISWSDNAANEVGYRLQRRRGDSGAFTTIDTLESGTTSYTNTGLTANTQYSYRIKTVNNTGSSNEVSVTTAEAGVGDVVFATNAGGGLVVGKDGISYEADYHFSGGNTYTWSGAYDNTEDDALYGPERYGTSFSYKVPLPAGTYEVTFKFADTKTRAGERIFNVAAEGLPLLSNVDIYASAGASYKAYEVTRSVTVSDGSLNLDFSGTNSPDRNATIKGLLIKKINDPASVITAVRVDTEAEPTAIVFPNPAATRTTFRYFAQKSGQVQVLVRDVLGKVVISQHYPVKQGANDLSLNLSEASSGIHAITATGAGATVQVKLVVQK